MMPLSPVEVPPRGERMRSQAKIRVLLLPLFAALASCGGGGGSGSGGGGNPFNQGSSTWRAGVFQPSTNFDNMCANPRPNTSDRQGTVTDENNFLRSWSNELYLWYSEITDRDPALYTTSDYFNLLKTAATTASGAPKDKFHFTYATDDWIALSQGGTEAGYGAEFAIVAPYAPRRIVVAFTDPGTPASANLSRGDEVLFVDGVDAVNDNTQAGVDTLNTGQFPEVTGLSNTNIEKNTAGVPRTVTIAS